MSRDRYKESLAGMAVALSNKITKIIEFHNYYYSNNFSITVIIYSILYCLCCSSIFFYIINYYL